MIKNHLNMKINSLKSFKILKLGNLNTKLPRTKINYLPIYHPFHLNQDIKMLKIYQIELSSPLLV